VLALHGGDSRQKHIPLTRIGAIERVIAIANGKASSSQVFELATGTAIDEAEFSASINRDARLLRNIEKLKPSLREKLHVLAEGSPRARILVRDAASGSLFGRIIVLPTFDNLTGESPDGNHFIIPDGLHAACDYVLSILATEAGAERWTLGECRLEGCGEFFITENAGSKSGAKPRRYCGAEHRLKANKADATERKRRSRRGDVKARRKK
jgi:hypothetical protein